MDLNHLLREYAIESGALPVEVTEGAGDALLSEVLSDEAEVSRAPGLSEQLDHADKAEAIADQLDVLAERAEEQAAEDKDQLVAQISVESMHREFATIMSANGLELKAASFESATDVKSQMLGLVKDARSTSKVTRGFADQLRDVSTEGAIMQFLRQDKARLKKAHDALQASAAELTSKKAELGKNPVHVNHDGLNRFLTVNGEPVANAKTAIEHDIAWLKKAEAQVNKAAADIASTLASTHGEGDHSAAVSKLEGIISGLGTGLEGHLLGNHTVAGGKRSGGEKFNGKAAAISYVTSGAKALPKGVMLVVGGTAAGAALGAVGGAVGGAVAGGAVGGIVGGVAGVGGGTVVGAMAGSVAAAKHGHKALRADYSKRVDGTDAKSVAGAGDLVKIAQELLSLTSATDFSMDAKVEEAGEKLEGAPADVKAAGKKAISAVSKMADVVYEHAIYLTVKSAQLVSAAAKAA